MFGAMTALAALTILVQAAPLAGSAASSDGEIQMPPPDAYVEAEGRQMGAATATAAIRRARAIRPRSRPRVAEAGLPGRGDRVVSATALPPDRRSRAAGRPGPPSAPRVTLAAACPGSSAPAARPVDCRREPRSLDRGTGGQRWNFGSVCPGTPPETPRLRCVARGD